jgi:hypothetical protein
MSTSKIEHKKKKSCIQIAVFQYYFIRAALRVCVVYSARLGEKKKEDKARPATPKKKRIDRSNRERETERRNAERIFF